MGIVRRVLPALRDGSWVAYDTEGSGLYTDQGATVSAISIAWMVADQVQNVATRPGCAHVRTRERAPAQSALEAPSPPRPRTAPADSGACGGLPSPCGGDQETSSPGFCCSVEPSVEPSDEVSSGVRSVPAADCARARVCAVPTGDGSGGVPAVLREPILAGRDCCSGGPCGSDPAPGSTSAGTAVPLPGRYDLGGGIELEVHETPQGLMAAIALPFDQGPEGKPGWNGQGTLDLFGAGTGEQVNLSESEWRDTMSWLLGGWGGTKSLCGHNLLYDLIITQAGTRHWSGEDLIGVARWDTLLACRELWPTESGALKTTAARLWGEEQIEEQTALRRWLGPKTDPRFDLVPWDIIRPYAVKDAILTLRLLMLQLDLVGAGESLSAGSNDPHWSLEREFEVMRLLVRMERRGLPYDRVSSLQVADGLRRYQRGLGERLPFRPTAPAAKKYFFGSPDEVTDRGVRCLGLRPDKVSERTGSASLDTEAVGLLASRGVEWAAEWGLYNKIEHAIGKWYQGYADACGADGRLRCRFRQTGTRTGRFSVERINLQALPHEYRLGAWRKVEQDPDWQGWMTGGPDWSGVQREIPGPRDLIAKRVRELPGWSLWDLDLAQAELRVASMLAGCERMAALVRSGQDLHGATATALFDVKPGDPDWSVMRQLGKRSNFSLLFDVGWRTFKASISKEIGLELGTAQAQRIVRDWKALYPEHVAAVHRTMRRVARMPVGARYVELANGKHKYFGPGDDTHKAHNNRVQGSIGQLVLDWLLATERIVQANGIDRTPDGGQGGVVLTVHDSITLLLPDGLAGAITSDCRQAAIDLWLEHFGHQDEGKFPAWIPGDVDIKEFG